MPSRESRHSASYDENGDIILPDMEENSPSFIESVEPVEPVTPHSFLDDELWESVEYASVSRESAPDVFPEIQRKRNNARLALLTVASSAKEVLKEGLHQYKVSVDAAPVLLKEARGGFLGALKRLWAALSQPVWVRSGKKHVRQYSRGTLFLIDIVRFGGTFATIFGVLFLAMNYQSFIQIASAKLDIFLEHPSLDNATSIADSALLGSTTGLNVAARDRGELFSYLPTVGPPDNRVIIPALKLNIPLVNPSVEALLRQDWSQVEADIQSALQQGVVHYPGTARPGQAGNFFVTGHSSYYPWDPGKYKTVFARLHELNIGDEYWVYFNGDRHRYVVDKKYEIQPSDTSVLDQPADQRISTLMTCTPTGTTLRRLIVRATEVDPITGTPLAVGERTDKEVVPKVQLEALPI